jgi:phosphatidate cytidylyltransferase
MAGRDEPGSKFEDLFEDLDKFFAPIEQVDRPLRDEEGSQDPAHRSVPDAPSEPAASAREDPNPDDPDTDQDESGKAAPAVPSAPPPIPALDQTGEMTGQDWERLRDALGDQVVQSASAPSNPGPSSEEPPFGPTNQEDPDPPPPGQPGGAGGVGDERRELSIEDLKKAPPEYRDLPGVGGQSEARSSGAADPDPREDEPKQPATTSDPDVHLDDAVPAWDEPGLAEVEAAADRLAEEFGSGSEGASRESHPSDEPGAVDADLLPDLEQPLGTPHTVKVGEPGSLTGPTWEEPTGSHPLMGEPSLPAGIGRDLPSAVLTALALVVVAAISLAVAKAAFAVVAGAIVLIGQAELYAAMHRRGYQPATALGLVVGGLVLAGAFLKGETAMLFFLALGLVLSFLWYMAGSPKARENAIQNIGSTLLGLLYVPFLAGYALILLSQPRSGRALMLVVIGLSVVYDIAAFFFGTFWGSHALAPTISPKKSREGLYGATVITFALSIGLVPTVIKYLSLADAVGLAVIVSVFAPLGDLAESALKRDLGVKDMGAVLPGHGGVLDRIDSILFVAPAALYFLRLIL